MRCNMWILKVLGGTVLLGAAAMGAYPQGEPAGPPPPPDALIPGGPMGGRMEILGFGEMHPGTVVAGAPYSAVAVLESKQALADGNSINRQTHTNIYRDSQGRTRREMNFPAVGPLAATGAPKTVISIFDPVASTAYRLHPDTKTAEQMPGRKGGKNGAGDLQAKFEARVQKQIADGTLRKEDLGVQTINGISAQGTRYTHTIPAGQMGNERDIVVTSERWYSPDLQIVVKATHNDPRFGQTTYMVTSVQRQEPAATLFTVPSDYTVQAAKMPMRGGKGRHGFGMAPPPGGAESAPPPPPPGE